MVISTFVFLGILVVIFIYGIILYKNLASLKHNVEKAWSSIDALLEQRHDELPKLVETCKQYMKHEQETLDKVMHAHAEVFNARKKSDVGALGTAETQLRMGLGNLFALAGSYPELKANDDFQHLQLRISDLGNAIANQREFYNESAKMNNIHIKKFPNVLIAGLSGFKPRDLLEFSEEETQDVEMTQLFT